MKITYNRKAIMAYAHAMIKRGWSLSDALKSAWEAAKYIRGYDIIGLKQATYKSNFPLVIADGVTWVPADDAAAAVWNSMYRYGTN
jgi:hypothetical protein